MGWEEIIMKYVPSSSRLNILSDLKSVEIFLSVVETRSLTRTAEKLRVAPSTVSKKMAELEERAKAHLISRTTRKVEITQAGMDFYAHCSRLMDEAELAERAIASGRDSLAGRLRVTAPIALTERTLMPHIADFLVQNPAVEIDLDTSTNTKNLRGEGFDLSIRMVARFDVEPDNIVLHENHRHFYASPNYLAEHGEPKHPRDLTAHSCLIVRQGSAAASWPYNDRGRFGRINVSGPFTSNNANTIAELAASGLGVALLGAFIGRDYEGSGRLVRVLEAYSPPASVVVAAAPDCRHLSRPSRAFIDHLSRRLKDVRQEPAALPKRPMLRLVEAL
ncbi:LysR family transcriptional regulator [Chelatococcus asaccharovorans]|uniref:LysR family transcriptional regulator n=2 Tax=Chelatococcus asaccharovorans TaxID=28210 RepID=A0A2V3TXQ8_9HYPH|nr:LysR family transcriptional regulator [Chelatococcus asaccharovorans]